MENISPIPVPWKKEQQQLGRSSEISADGAPFDFVAVSDLTVSEPEYIIDELIETETLCLMFGDPGCGKSFLAVDIAASVASGEPFHGKAVKQGSVFLIAGEGHNGLVRRFHAWSKDRGVPLDGLPLFKSERAAQFLDAASAKAVGQSVDELALRHGAPVLIIIDTVARNFGAGDENSTSDMSHFILSIDDLKARFPGCAVLLIHHTGHNAKDRARGAMALKAALDCEFCVKKNGDTIQISNSKMKDAETPQDLFFSFRKVSLGGNIKSAVLVSKDAPEPTQTLTLMMKIAVTAYRTAIETDGLWDGDVSTGVHIKDWRRHFYETHPAGKPEAKRKAFSRVRHELFKSGQMTVQDDICLIADGVVQAMNNFMPDKRDIAGQKNKCPDAEAGDSGTGGTYV